MKKITWFLSFGVLVVVMLDGVGALEGLKQKDETPAYATPAIDKIAVVEDGTVYLITLVDGVWCQRGGKTEKVAGILNTSLLGNVDKNGNSLYLSAFDYAYQIKDCRAYKINLPEVRVDR